MKRLGVILAVVALPVAASAQASAPLPADVQVPAKTELRLHVDAPLSSDQSKTGQHFAFTMADPVVVDGRTVVERGAHGDGTLLLAGHAGSRGHEGDLTLRFDGVHTSDGRWLAFDGQRVEINGRNRKATSFFAGLIPIAGYGADFIRGSEVRISPEAVVKTTLLKPAAVVAAEPAPGPAPTSR